MGRTRFRRLELQRNDLQKKNVKRGMGSSLKGNRNAYRFVSELIVFVLFSCHDEQGEQLVFCVEKKYLLLRCDSVL